MKQKSFAETDALVIKFDDFERVLIFDREPYHFTGVLGENFNKQIFLQCFQMLMTIAVHLDQDARGNFGMVKDIKKPNKILYKKDLFKNKHEESSASTQKEFNLKNAIAVFENDKLHFEH